MTRKSANTSLLEHLPPGFAKFLTFFLALVASVLVGLYVQPVQTVEQLVLNVQEDEAGRLYYTQGQARNFISPVPINESPLNPAAQNGSRTPTTDEDFVYRIISVDGVDTLEYLQLTRKEHWGFWSLLPALVAIVLCWVTREPLTALFGGIVSGAFVLTRYDLTGEVLVPELGTVSAAGILVLYLWLLGGLMGVWSKTGAAQAFAEFMTVRFVRGPRTAKLVAWMLGVIFFQGGTVSTVLVGTTVKPIADKERISHEELSYIVDSTASPIASQLAFNAWPGYIQAFIFVGGVSFLATEADRLRFFFTSVPFCFYAIFAVLGTFLLSIDKSPWLGSQMRAAIDRARSTGALNRKGAQVLASEDLEGSDPPTGYSPSVLEFFLPLGLLIATAIGTFIVYGSPRVHWAFGLALVVAGLMALAKGMALRDLIAGFEKGLKGIVMGSVILMLAVTLGSISQQTGAGTYLVEQLGEFLPFFLLPVILQVMTMVIAFSTGTSWGTYAVAFPLAMPLAWSIAGSAELSNPYLFMTLCFAAVMDGSVYGDQCSPISDTTVLSSVCTGCDLMDHVKTQIPQASLAAGLAAVCWTLLALLTA